MPMHDRLMPASARSAARTIIACTAIIAGSSHAACALTLAEAVEAAMAAHPDLAALEHERQALVAAVGQARLLPNPELQTEVENVAGNGSRKDDDAAESTLRLAQRFELGGKRTARARVATASVDVAAAEVELRRRQLAAEVKIAFAAALAAEQRSALARDLERLAADALRSAGSAVEAGALSTAERDRARLDETKAQRERVLRERQAIAARASLAASWGDTVAFSGELVGRLGLPISLPSRDRLSSLEIESHPAILHAEALIAERSAAVSLERAKRVPDVSVAAGARHFNDEDDVAAVFSISAPLPLFDRNQGAMAEAEARLAKARAERRSVELSLRTSLLAAYDECVSAEEQRVLIEDSVIPAAERALETVTAAHRRGLSPYHEVVDAKRALNDVRLDRIDLLEMHFAAIAELERVSGLSLAGVSTGELQ